MEKYTRTCRFILDCNYASKIIDPIQSRCTVFRFNKLAFDEVKPYLERIAKAEKLNISADAYKAIYEVSEGDCRRAVNILQSCSTAKKIAADTVFKTASQASPKEIETVVSKAVSGKFGDARKELFDTIIKYGLSGIDVVKAVHSAVMRMKLPEKTRMKLVSVIGEYEFRIVEGSDEYIQLSAMLAQFGILGK
jgi:replication factor C small subunit